MGKFESTQEVWNLKLFPSLPDDWLRRLQTVAHFHYILWFTTNLIEKLFHWTSQPIVATMKLQCKLIYTSSTCCVSCWSCNTHLLTFQGLLITKSDSAAHFREHPNCAKDWKDDNEDCQSHNDCLVSPRQTRIPRLFSSFVIISFYQPCGCCCFSYAFIKSTILLNIFRMSWGLPSLKADVDAFIFHHPNAL